MRRMTILLVLGALCLSSCAANWGSFERLAAKAPEGLTEKGARVSGSDCNYFGYWWRRSIAEAARDALRKAPGATGLRDVEVSWKTIIIAQCMVVTGTPVTDGGK